MKIFFIVRIVILILVLTGYIKCIYKAVNCNWNPVGKAEVWYLIGSCTGLGSIIGWIDIEDK